jgi:lipopolysaccharide export system permease protein
MLNFIWFLLSRYYAVQRFCTFPNYPLFVILDTSFRRESARTLIATLVVLLTVFMTFSSLRMLRSASAGAIDPQDVAFFIGLSTIGYSAQLLTIALLIAVLVVLSRWYRESEMAVWLSSGVGLPHMIGPVLRFSWPVLLIIAALTLVVWPWHNQQLQALRDRFEQRNDLARASPGQFKESSGGRRVFFFEGEPAAGQGRQVFVRIIDGRSETVTLAARGAIVRENDKNQLQLSAGRRYEFLAADTANNKPAEARVASFERYVIDVKEELALPQMTTPARATHTLELLRSSDLRLQGELFWRLSLPLSAIVLCLLAVPLAAVQPRAGRGWHVLFAMLVFFTYYQLSNLGQAWVAQGRFGWLQLLFVLHGVAFAWLLFMIWRKSSGWTLTNSLSRLGAARRIAALRAASGS